MASPQKKGELYLILTAAGWQEAWFLTLTFLILFFCFSSFPYRDQSDVDLTHYSW